MPILTIPVNKATTKNTAPVFSLFTDHNYLTTYNEKYYKIK